MNTINNLPNLSDLDRPKRTLKGSDFTPSVSTFHQIHLDFDEVYETGNDNLKAILLIPGKSQWEELREFKFRVKVTSKDDRKVLNYAEQHKDELIQKVNNIIQTKYDSAIYVVNLNVSIGSTNFDFALGGFKDDPEIKKLLENKQFMDGITEVFVDVCDMLYDVVRNLFTDTPLKQETGETATAVVAAGVGAAVAAVIGAPVLVVGLIGVGIYKLFKS